MMRKFLCYCAGLALAMMIAVIAIAGPATRTGLFVRALKATVNTQALGVTEAELIAFGKETMRYLRGEKDCWEPQIPHQGIGKAFYDHMAEVRGWLQAAPWVLLALAAVMMAFMWLGSWQRRPVFWGVWTFVGLVLAVLLWAVVDFGSMWMILHRVLIPGGIFSAFEPAMQLFPLGLFFRYIPSVCLCFAALLTLSFAALCLKRKTTRRNERP